MDDNFLRCTAHKQIFFPLVFGFELNHMDGLALLQHKHNCDVVLIFEKNLSCRLKETSNYFFDTSRFPFKIYRIDSVAAGGPLSGFAIKGDLLIDEL